MPLGWRPLYFLTPYEKYKHDGHLKLNSFYLGVDMFLALFQVFIIMFFLPYKTDHIKQLVK